jgi:hypothetical protein
VIFDYAQRGFLSSALSSVELHKVPRQSRYWLSGVYLVVSGAAAPTTLQTLGEIFKEALWPGSSLRNSTTPWACEEFFKE